MCFFKQKTAYEMRISDWSSDVCSSDLAQIQRLEAQLGFEIFDRKGRSAHLNRKGHQVLLQAQELLRLYDNLGGGTAELTASVLINIGAIASVQRSYLPDALARFHKHCPQRRTRILPGVSMEWVNRSEERRVGNECVGRCRSQRSAFR